MVIITDSRCTEYHAYGHPERPARISRTVERLRSQTRIPITWKAPKSVNEAQLLRAHSPLHLRRLRDPDDFDADTPGHVGIREHAERSVGAGIQALDLALAGESVVSLIRPPGHHATSTQAMGFCYLNTAAIVTLEAMARGLGKAAVFDFDVHHGNGTEAILRGREDCAFFSVHQFPAYPGTGQESLGNAFNQPVPPGVARSEYREALETMLNRLAQFRPSFVVVSAGFDAYRGDPLSCAPLEAEDFEWIGRQLKSLDLPFCSLLEGGYSDDLPDLILSYLQGVETG